MCQKVTRRQKRRSLWSRAHKTEIRNAKSRICFPHKNTTFLGQVKFESSSLKHTTSTEEWLSLFRSVCPKNKTPIYPAMHSSVKSQIGCASAAETNDISSLSLFGPICRDSCASIYHNLENNTFCSSFKWALFGRPTRLHADYFCEYLKTQFGWPFRGQTLAVMCWRDGTVYQEIRIGRWKGIFQFYRGRTADHLLRVITIIYRLIDNYWRSAFRKSADTATTTST